MSLFKKMDNSPLQKPKELYLHTFFMALVVAAALFVPYIIKDNGYFGTTPFFVSFVEDPAKLRRAQYLYLMSLCQDFSENNDAAKKYIAESTQLNNENLFAIFFDKFGFLDT